MQHEIAVNRSPWSFLGVFREKGDYAEQYSATGIFYAQWFLQDYRSKRGSLIGTVHTILRFPPVNKVMSGQENGGVNKFENILA